MPNRALLLVRWLHPGWCGCEEGVRVHPFIVSPHSGLPCESSVQSPISQLPMANQQRSQLKDWPPCAHEGYFHGCGIDNVSSRSANDHPGEVKGLMRV